MHAHSESGVWGWARGKAECTFAKPVRYEDVIELHLLVREKTEKTLTYEIVFWKLEAGGDAVEVARGSMTVICVGKAPGEERLRAVAMPADVDALVEVAPRELSS